MNPRTAYIGAVLEIIIRDVPSFGNLASSRSRETKQIATEQISEGLQAVRRDRAK